MHFLSSSLFLSHFLVSLFFSISKSFFFIPYLLLLICLLHYLIFVFFHTLFYFSLTYSSTSSFSDKDEEMADFARSVLQKTLGVKYPDFFAQHFSECLLVMNDCQGAYGRTCSQYVQ